MRIGNLDLAESRTLKNYKTEFTMLGIFLIFFIIMSLSSSYFLSVSNMINVSSQIAVTGIIAIGQTFVIITAGIDLSVGSIMAISGILLGMCLSQTHSILMAVLIGLGVSLLFGIINGVLIGYFRLPAFIATLGTQSIASSLAYVISNGNSYAKFPQSYSLLGTGKFFGIPYYLILMLVLYAFFIWVMNKTKVGRFTYAIGSNEEAVKMSGINVAFHTMIPYIIIGLLSGIAAIVNTSRLMAVDPTFGTGTEMDTIAAVVIGGTSMAGGKGTLYGTLIGVLLIGFLRNALNLLGVNPFWQGTAVGAVIIIAVLAERISSSLKSK